MLSRSLQAPGPSRRDSHTRVEYVRDPTYTERLSRSCSGILFGWLILFGAVFLLYWNEGRAVAQYNTIQEGIGMCVSEGFLDEASAPAQAPLIHFTARLAPEQVRDEQFGVKVSAVTLERIVETYQWHEKQDRREYKVCSGQAWSSCTFVCLIDMVCPQVTREREEGESWCGL